VKVFVDEMLSPQVVRLFEDLLGIPAEHTRTVSEPVAADRELFELARREDAAILTKDRDLVDLVEARGRPPAIIWLRCGNTSNVAMAELLSESADVIRSFLASQDLFIEIR